MRDFSLHNDIERQKAWLRKSLQDSADMSLLADDIREAAIERAVKQFETEARRPVFVSLKPTLTVIEGGKED